ncbi:MAG: (d)CMP kinase [Candidatus Hinthialibacter sp.]
MKRSQPIVAIDGPVGVGKSSVAAKLADRLQFLYIDTGAMYRTVALKALRQGLDLNDRPAVARLAQSLEIHLQRSGGRLIVFCDGEDVTEAIRTPEISAATSPAADNPQVRERLVSLQREMGRRGGVVMEGRDIATVVFPDAELQFYLDADPRIRAQRRFLELKAKGKNVTFDQTLTDLLERDRRDRERPVGALAVSDHATVIDTTDLNQDQVIQKLYDLVYAWQAK